MPLSRVIALGLGLAALSQTACSSSIPWPPRHGSCIEASIGKGRRAKWRFRLDDEKVSRESIERTLSAASPSWRRGVDSSDALSVAGPVVLVGGDIASIGGLAAAEIGKRPQLLFISLAGLSMIVAGIGMMVNAEEPFRRSVLEYNQSDRNLCRTQPRTERSSESPTRTQHSDEPPAPSGLPTLPSGSWTP